MIHKNKRVSILIVTFNAEKFIQRTIESCLNQSYEDIEILVLDNSSTDGTVETIKKIDNLRVTLFKGKENIGPYAGLNFLLDKARGEYIAIQDHDDIWFPEKIEKQVKFLEENQQVLACGTETFYYYEKRELFLLDNRQGFVNFVDHTSLIFRNKGFRYKTKYLLADEYFEKKVLKSRGPIFCIGEPLTIHRIRSDGNNFSHQRFSFTKENLTEFFEINGFNAKAIIYLAGIFFEKYFPEKIVWFVINNIAKRKSKKISKSEFIAKYSKIDL